MSSNPLFRDRFVSRVERPGASLLQPMQVAPTVPLPPQDVVVSAGERDLFGVGQSVDIGCLDVAIRR